jgi:hypothetical protein
MGRQNFFILGANYYTFLEYGRPFGSRFLVQITIHFWSMEKFSQCPKKNYNKTKPPKTNKLYIFYSFIFNVYLFTIHFSFFFFVYISTIKQICLDTGSVLQGNSGHKKSVKKNVLFCFYEVCLFFGVKTVMTLTWYRHF